MNSIWVQDVSRTYFEPLTGNARTDVLIIGGGMAGLLCAHALRQEGIDCLLVEAGQICGGVTQNTTAKLTVQHGLFASNLIKRFGVEHARIYLEGQKRGFDDLLALCRDIPCDLARKDSYVYSRTHNRALEDELDALARLGAVAEYVEASRLPMPKAGAIRMKDQAQFHPLKLAFGLAASLPIHEHTKIIELAPHRARTETGEIRCEKMIIATHFPMLNKHGSYFLKLYQHRSYVLALEDAADVDGMYVDEAEDGLSFRNAGNLLLLGGGSHRTGKQGGGWRVLEDFARTHYQAARIQAKWATQDCMTLDGIPYIGQYSARTPDLYVATGFNKWGMTSAAMAATLLRDAVCGKESALSRVVCPSRSILRAQLAVNAFESLAGLLTPTTPRCPHLGCALKYNRAEHSWDCACHGSRFSEDGRLLTGPATGGLRKKVSRK